MKKLLTTIFFLVIINLAKSQCTPPSTFAVGPYYIPCGFNSVVISAGTNSSVTTYSYSWNGPGGMSCPSGMSCYNNNVNGAGVYTVTIYDTAQPGCFSTNTMSVIQASTGLFVSMSGNDTICSGATAFVSAFVSGPTSYTWSTGSNSSGISVTPTLTTVYSVSATSMFSGCTGSNSFTVNVLLCLGVSNLTTNENIFIGPNPNNGEFTVSMNANIEEAEIAILNAIGKEVFYSRIREGINKINLDFLPKGIYYYSITQNKELLKRNKILIQ